MANIHRKKIVFPSLLARILKGILRMLISDIKLGTDDSEEESDKENQLYKYLKLCLDKRRRKIKASADSLLVSKKNNHLH